jgi:hypothetical protein
LICSEWMLCIEIFAAVKFKTTFQSTAVELIPLSYWRNKYKLISFSTNQFISIIESSSFSRSSQTVWVLQTWKYSIGYVVDLLIVLVTAMMTERTWIPFVIFRRPIFVSVGDNCFDFALQSVFLFPSHRLVFCVRCCTRMIIVWTTGS